MSLYAPSYGYGLRGKPLLQAWPYEVIVPAVTTPVTLDQVKEFLKLDPTDTSQDTFLTTLINACTQYAERYTKRDFINKTYRTYRDYFSGCGIELRKSLLQQVVTVDYINQDNVQTTVPTTVYFSTQSNDYSSIFTQQDQVWPTDVRMQRQSVIIEFVAGYGDTSSDVPADLQLALLNHISAMYSDRGDCCDCASTLPGNAKAIYDIYMIMSLWAPCN